MSQHYRPEIDGLRAVAVLPVILFHAGFAGFSGGYVGVDVFFVISGYLITGILLAEIAGGRFSFASFYERRARRLLPALFVVMVACVPFAWAWMTPDQLRDFGRSVFATTLFSSNILFWLESGYFSAAAETKPLLHTWSLAVEEQYYLVFPILMVVLWRFGIARLTLAVVLIALASFALAQFGGNLQHPAEPGEAFRWNAAPVFAYYLAPTRIWELLAGALIALRLHRVAGDRRKGNDLLALVGLGAIAAAVILYDRSTPFPGAYALLPVLGTVLVIRFGTETTQVGRLLAARWLVGIGLLSYSAYLWHQPLFAFARLRSLTEPGAITMLLLAGCALGLAYLTWRYVEQPFRSRTRLTQRQVLTAAASTASLFLAVGLTMHVADGFPQRFGPELARMSKPPVGNTIPCSNVATVLEGSAARTCTIGRAGMPPGYAVLGDSHAAALTDALDGSGAELNQTLLPVNDHWCAPLHEFGTTDADRNPRCRALMTRALEAVAADPAIHTVLLVAEWSNYTTGTRWGHPRVARYTEGASSTDDTDNSAAFAHAFARTLEILRDKQVIVVKSVPEYHSRVPEALAKALMFGDGELPQPLLVSLEEYQARNQQVEAIWSRVDAPNLRYFDTAGTFCDPATRTCRYRSADGPLYVDDNHLSLHGARELVARILREHPPGTALRAAVGSI
ncbi:MAG: acyltransferase [Pseudomonadales bacterium]|nr:acyltransferase [Pseudomonadales bacterium]